MPKYRVVSIDGGGIRGLITTILLQRIIATPGLEHFIDSIDFIAGTSTGGLLALGIAHRIDLAKIRDVYVSRGPRVFADTWWHDLVNLGHILGAEYTTAPLRRELVDLFGDITLGQLSKRVLITAFDLDNEDPDPMKRTWKPKLFHNFPGANNDRAYSAVDVGLYTSAAPTYFPSVDGYIDGGVYAANPSMCALAQTQDNRYAPIPALGEVLLFSLGTGTTLQYVPGKTHDWGYAQWVKPLISLLLDGTSGIADYQCSQVLDKRYHRLSPTLPPDRSIRMDSINEIAYMVEFAEAVPMDGTIEWLKKIWMVD